MCECNINIMEEVLACRACLATDVKLFNMYKYDLVTAFEILTSTQMSTTDGLPLQLCTLCSALLIKCTRFQDRCRTSQQLLNYAVLEQNLITTDYIRSVDRETHNLTSPYTVEHDIYLNTTYVIKPKCIVKNESNTLDNTNEEIEENQIKFEEKTETSDEEPLAKKIVKIPNRKRKRKKRKSAETSIDIEIKDEIEENDEYDNIDDNFDTFNNDKQNLEYSEINNEIDVIKLTKQEQIEEVQSRKKSLNYLNSFYKCDKCFKGFMTEGTFRNHMSRHDPAAGAHSCGVCATRWPCARALRAHALTSHERKYVCKRCNHVSKSSHRAKEHSKWHEGFMYVCVVCGATFSKSTSHLTHIRLQHPSEHSCDICGESFIGRYGLNMHKKKAHRRTEDENVKCESQCATCGVQFKSAEALESHVTSSKDHICDPSLKSCVFCGWNCCDEESLRDHVREHHQREHSVQCAECDRKFANSRTYAVHYQHFHLGGAPGLRGRSTCRSPAESVVCEMCGKKCMSKATLVYHQRTHTGEKPYQCTECPKRFSIYQRLQIHQRTHTGERPFKCSHCPKAFKQKAALNRHVRVHTGAKPYACSHCGKTFSQSNSMKMHVRTVHLKMPAPYRHSRKTKLE